MWRKLLLAFVALVATLILAVVAGGGFLVVKTMKPEVVQPSLKKEFDTPGLTTGRSDRAEMVAKYGPPETERDETLSTLYEYPARGLRFRFSKEDGSLDWYEVTSSEFDTGKGIRVGATYDDIVAAYGPPSEVATLSKGPRLRYYFGTAYALEFTLNNEGRLVKIVFFHS